MPVSCSNEGCDKIVSKRDVKHHENELCQFKTTTCDDCGKKMPHHKYGAHGCVLRCDVDEIKKDLAETKKDLADVKAIQHEMVNEMREGMQRITIAIENLQNSSRNVADVVNAMKSDLVLIGGEDHRTRKVISSVERFNFINKTWTPFAELKTAREFHAAVVFENQILVCGGSTIYKPLNATDSIEVLNLNDNPPTWREFAVNLPVKVTGHKCVVYGNRLLIVGGKTEKGIFLNTIYELLLVPPYSCKLLCHMKKNRAFHGVELFDDKVLIAGGVDTEADIEIFDITRNKCIEMPPLLYPRAFMATVRCDDSMLLIGGQANKDEFPNDIIEYDFKTGQSKVLMEMESETFGCSAVYSGNILVVICRPSVDCFSFSTNSWKKLPSITNARIGACAALVNKF